MVEPAEASVKFNADLRIARYVISDWDFLIQLRVMFTIN